MDLEQGESFGFLGFEFRRIRSRRGRWMPLYVPKGKKRTALLRKLKAIFRSFRSQPVNGLIEMINPILRGWVKYFAVGHSSWCFSYVRSWVEKKIPRHLGRARERRGFGWKRGGGSRAWLYQTLGLFAAYRVAYRQPCTAVAPCEWIALINLDAKCAGARSEGNPHAACEVQVGRNKQYLLQRQEKNRQPLPGARHLQAPVKDNPWFTMHIIVPQSDGWMAAVVLVASCEWAS